jgi:hypothetical protein
VDVVLRSLRQPVADQLGLVDRRVVEDQVDIEVGWDVGVDLVEEPAELGGAGSTGRSPFPP